MKKHKFDKDTWHVGQKVWSIQYGKGEVEYIHSEGIEICVKFKTQTNTVSYRIDGKFQGEFKFPDLYPYPVEVVKVRKKEKRCKELHSELESLKVKVHAIKQFIDASVWGDKVDGWSEMLDRLVTHHELFNNDVCGDLVISYELENYDGRKRVTMLDVAKVHYNNDVYVVKKPPFDRNTWEIGMQVYSMEHGFGTVIKIEKGIRSEITVRHSDGAIVKFTIDGYFGYCDQIPRVFPVIRSDEQE